MLRLAWTLVSVHFSLVESLNATTLSVPEGIGWLGALIVWIVPLSLPSGVKRRVSRAARKTAAKAVAQDLLNELRKSQMTWGVETPLMVSGQLCCTASSP